jgi:hypothetical protein
VGLLTSLTWFGLGENRVSGTLPTELAQLARGATITLGGNALSGTLSPALASAAVRSLYVDRNRLSGTLPTNIGQLGTGRITPDAQLTPLSEGVPPLDVMSLSRNRL